jgi:hypothetical protein
MLYILHFMWEFSQTYQTYEVLVGQQEETIAHTLIPFIVLIVLTGWVNIAS